MPVALSHQVGHVHFQRLSQIVKRPHFSSAVLANGHAECIRRLVGLRVRHLEPYATATDSSPNSYLDSLCSIATTKPLPSSQGRKDMPNSTRCADCGRTDNLVKCSKADCISQLCPDCADAFTGRHCNGCYVSGNVGAMTGGLQGFR